jgi:hypothetical protein
MIPKLIGTIVIGGGTLLVTALLRNRNAKKNQVPPKQHRTNPSHNANLERKYGTKAYNLGSKIHDWMDSGSSDGGSGGWSGDGGGDGGG